MTVLGRPRFEARVGALNPKVPNRLLVALSLLIVFCFGGTPSSANGPLAEGTLEVRGARLTIYADADTNDADQVVNVGERARVRTCYGAVEAACGEVSPGDPRIANLEVRAELRGPELVQAVPLATVPGGAFLLPGFQQEGDYLLENIRLVNTLSGEVLGASEPSVAVVRVFRIVLASAVVRTLSLEDLEARGISITQENFQAFDFAVGFLFNGTIVDINLPVLYEGGGEVTALSSPTVVLDGLPPGVAEAVGRWQPPSIVPFTLELPEVDVLDADEEPWVPITFPVFGAIVMPGNVSFLNQFFDATLIVANGAPQGAGVVLSNLEATLRLPGGNVLRIANTEPPVAPGQKVPMMTAGRSHLVGEGEQATATWTVEGLVAGTHALQMDVKGELQREGRPTVPVATRAQAAVEVVDARFHLVFSHPDVVRKDTAYSLFVTVTNLSRVTQNLVSVAISGEIEGAHKEDLSDTFEHKITFLESGHSETLEFRLVADVTGQVVGGTYESSSSSGTGAIELYTGVGEFGIPLSPATLRLPRFSERLAPPFVESGAYMSAINRFLGLAYSLAVAPAGMTPQGLPRVIRSDVEARAVDLGFAGQRTFLNEGLLETLEVLLLDQLGNRQPLAEIDALRRATDPVHKTGAELAALLRIEQEAKDFGAVELLDHFAETTSYANPYLAAMLIPGIVAEAPVLEIRRLTGDGWTYLARTSGDTDPLRTLAFGDVLAVNERANGGKVVPLAVVGSVPPGQHHEIYLHNTSDEPVAGRLLLIVADGDDGGYRRVDFGAVTVPPHRVYGVTAGSDIADDGFDLIDLASGDPVSGLMVHTDPVPSPPFRLIGARQDFGVAARGDNSPNRYGQGLSYLFNRPPDVGSAQRAANYGIRSTFDDGASEHRVSEKRGVQAFVQPSGRVVNVRYSSPISALWDSAADRPLVEHTHVIDPTDLVDPSGEALDPAIPEPVVEHPPDHLGGLVAGKVLRGTGAPAAGSTVRLIRPRVVDTPRGLELKLDLVGEVVTGEDGAFYFDFVEHPHPDPNIQNEFMLRAIVPVGDDPATEPATVEEVTSTIRLQNRLTYINIALLGRGSVTGELLYLDTGDPVEGGTVTVVSTLFNDSKTTTVDPDGSFSVPGMPVGPLTLTGRDSEGRVVYATVGIERPGEVVHVVLEMPRTQPPGMGTVVGTVLRQGSGPDAPPPKPIAGATVEVTAQGGSLGKVATDGFGHFRIANVPAGQVTVQAADWRISRTSVLTDLTLAADQVADVTLTLPDEQTRSVAGRVLFYDAASNSHLPVANASVFISGPGVFAYTGTDGRYQIDGVPAQAAGSTGYSVQAIDYERSLQGSVAIPPIVSGSPDVIDAQDIILRLRTGGIDGVVLDPLGRPLGGAEVISSRKGVPYTATTSKFDGSFSFDEMPLDEWQLTAHSGDGLEVGRVGYFGVSAKTKVVFGGHRPFTTVQMVGSGIVDLEVSSTTGTTWAQVYYRPTYYSAATKGIARKGVAIETETDPIGLIRLQLPVGGFEITVYSPFHGVRTVGGQVEWAGQVKNIDVVFDGSSTVGGQLVNVDGVTPIPDFEVALHTEKMLPRTQRTDAEGRFLFELVPEGRLEVRAEGTVGALERVGVATASLGGGGQNLELQVRMKAQGTVGGQVLERVGNQNVPLAHAQFYIREESYPFRRLPSGDGWYSADGEGKYQVSHIYAGSVSVTARDALQVGRQGSAKASISSDWQVVSGLDIVLTTSVGSVAVTIRDPETGAVLPDTQVRIRAGWDAVNELTVAGSTGAAHFDALPLSTYSITAFHAPTGRSGRLDGIRLSTPGQHVDRTLYVDQRGAVGGTLFDDAAMLSPVQGATVQLTGQTAGGPLTALDTTSGQPGSLGRFEFFGIPEGSFALTAAVADSPRRAGAEVALTATAPVAEVNLVLEPAGEIHFRIFENLSSGAIEVNPSNTLLSVRFQQPSSFDFTLLQPTSPFPDHTYGFFGVLLQRSGSLSVQELGGEQRRASAGASNLVNGVPLGGTGSEADPYRLTLSAKGVVRVQVVDADSQPVADANVTLDSTGGGRFPSKTGADGTVSFVAVPAGTLTVTASAPQLGVGGRNTAVLQFDDDVVDVVVTLGAAVSAHGIVYAPVPGDIYSGDPSTLVPQSEAIVIFEYGGSQLVMTTGPDGTYRFGALPAGAAFTVTAQTTNGQAMASTSGTLSGPNGNDNEIQPLILDGGPPQIVSISPPPGMEDVSRTAMVKIVFSEPLLSSVVPNNVATSPYFELRGPDGLAVGSWTSGIDSAGRHVVAFHPSQPYANTAYYGLKIRGGPSGVRDRIGRPLTPNGDVGSNFKTSDSIGPAIVGFVPDLDRPVEGTAPIRIDFNESLVAADEQLDGDGIDDAAVLFWAQADGSDVTWQPLPISMYLTRGNYSLTVDPVDGLELSDDTLLRNIVVSLLEDSQGNVMAPFERQFRIRDANPPLIAALPAPPAAPDGQLVPGTSYTVTPEISGIDFFPLDPPEGDLDRVEFFFQDPVAAGTGAQPGFVASTAPYAFSFVAAYSGNGVDPRPFPLWARAVDTSTNESNVVALEMVVLPNQAPVVGGVTATAVSPVPGTFYSGSSIRASVDGLGDVDGLQLALEVQLWEEGGGLLDVAPTLSLSRPTSGNWIDLPAPTRDLEIPQDVAEGAALYVRARVVDASGASATVESDRFQVADDDNGPVIEGLTVRSAADGTARSAFFIGNELYVEVVARDIETSVIEVTVEFDRGDIFASPAAANRISGDLFRTAVMTVPVDVFSEPATVTMTAVAGDRGGNSSTASRDFEVAPEPDPTAPTVEWLTPWEGAAWPASYTSVSTPGSGVQMLLRVRARDLNEDENGDPVVGNIVSVAFRGPVDDGAGGVVLSADAVVGVAVTGTEEQGAAEYQAIWPVPDQIALGEEVPFEVRVVDSGGLDVVRTVRMVGVVFRKVYEGVQSAVLDDDPMLAPNGNEQGGVFLVDGTILSISPQDNGSVRTLESLYLYAGGSGAGTQLTTHPSVLTAPEITSYASATPFYPLELDLEQMLVVGVDCRIDVSRRGPLGSTADDQMTLPGVSAAGWRAGGSHGGTGWFGAAGGGWASATLYQAASTYDSVRDPRLAGVGGGGWGSDAGGSGGGVVRIDVGEGVIHLVGDVRADGGDSVQAGGGGGGSVLLRAARFEGQGVVTANGGDGGRSDTAGGGGGGRIALSFGEVAGNVDLSEQVEAFGGGNGGSFRAGAGTVYLESLDLETWEPAGDGRLEVTNPVGLPAAPTLMPALGNGVVVAVDPTGGTVTVDVQGGRGVIPGETVVVEDPSGAEVAHLPIIAQQSDGNGILLTVQATQSELQSLQILAAGDELTVHGRARYSAVSVLGAVRLSFDDDLAIGAAGDPDPALNDPESVDLVDGARVGVRGDDPVVTATADPAQGTDVLVGSSIAVNWSASSEIGLWEVTQTWSPTGQSSTSRKTNQPLALSTDPDPLMLTVPADSPPGTATLELEVVDVAGRSESFTASWTIQENAAPVATLAFADGAPTTVQAGFSTTVVVHAEDVEGLASVSLNATGPAVAPVQTTAISGTSQDVPFVVWVVPDADGSTPITLQATVTDFSGTSVVTDSIQIVVVPDENPPTVSIGLAPVTNGDVYLSGQAVTITATPGDDVRVDFLSVTFDDNTVTSEGSPISLPWVAPPLTETAQFEIVAEARDASGNSTSVSRILNVEPVFSEEAPVVTFLCPVNGDGCAPATVMKLAFRIFDDEENDAVRSYRLLVNDVAYGDQIEVNAPVIEATIDWTVPAEAQPGEVFTLRLEATDSFGNKGFANIQLTVPPGTILTGNQLIDTDHAGEDLVLANGTFTATTALNPISLTILQGAKLETLNSQPLVITTGDLGISCLASIDVTGRGYGGNTTYPGATIPSHNSGAGSHIGEGGVDPNQIPGSTYGSVYRPQENGGGGESTSNGERGGGTVRIEAEVLDLAGTAAIRANGSNGRSQLYRPGAGGSLWITASAVTGEGVLEANGGLTIPGGAAYAVGQGGGGAIAIEYGSMDAGILDGLSAKSREASAWWKPGGAGTVYLYGPDSTYGDLVVNNGLLSTPRWTVLPSLGGGEADTGSDGVTLVTDRTKAIPAYFVGHWVEIRDAGGGLKGTWRVEAVDNLTVTLEAGASVTEGDTWRGVYRFDSVTVTGNAKLRVDDLDEFGTVDVDESSILLTVNREAPEIDEDLLGFVYGGDYQIHMVGSLSILDDDVPVIVTGRNVTRDQSWSESVAFDGSFDVVVVGDCGDAFEVTAVDTHDNPRTSATIEINLTDVVPPQIDASRIHISVHDQLFWVDGAAGAVTDSCFLSSASIIEPTQPQNPLDVNVLPDGGFAAIGFGLPEGTVLTVTATDGADNTASVDLPGLPVNNGPPIINPAAIVGSTGDGAYVIAGAGFCELDPDGGQGGSAVVCELPISSPDGVMASRLVNATSPFFATVELTMIEECPTCFTFDLSGVAGAIGDEIWLWVEDGHPIPAETSARVWTLPQVPGAPMVDLGGDDLAYRGNMYHLDIPAGAVYDPDGPLTISTTLWREVESEWIQIFTDATSMASGEALDVPLIGGQEGDIVIVEVTDSTGLSTTTRVGELPEAINTTVAFGSTTFTAMESDLEMRLKVMLSQARQTSVSVRYRTGQETAIDGEDFVGADDILVFDSGITELDIVIPIVFDSETELDEDFTVELLDPTGVDLGEPALANATILNSDRSTAVEVIYSVGPDTTNMLLQPTSVDLVNGTMVFSEPLPDGPDRGDKIVLDGRDPVFIQDCESASVCKVVDALGRVPEGQAGVTASAIIPAFSSLSAAFENLGKSDYLRSTDLTVVGRSLELLCYGGPSDTTPVLIDGWVTSPVNTIRIVAPDAKMQRGVSQRHAGTWSYEAYRLEISGTVAIESTVGNLTIEGLQLHVSGESAEPAAGIILHDLTGDVTIENTIIRVFGGQAAVGDRSGIRVDVNSPVDVVVRNTIIYEMETRWNSPVDGIRAVDSSTRVFAYNNTIVGLGVGLMAEDGNITAINNLVYLSAEASFLGDFSPDSRNNFSNDATAPNPPTGDVRRVTFRNPTLGLETDLHVGCGVMDQNPVIRHNLQTFSDEDIRRIFDGDPESLLISEYANPAQVRLIFPNPVEVTGVSVLFSHFWSHDWTLTAADSESEYLSEEGNVWLLARSEGLNNEHMAWQEVVFDQPFTARVFELTVTRNSGIENDLVHINEWNLYGLNPTCGRAADLSDDPQHPFENDVDGTTRLKPWDIGADQSSELTVGFAAGPEFWWEEEGAAQLQVMLSEPASAEVTVRYQTIDGAAVVGEDYQYSDGRLVFAAGEVIKVITVPLIEDPENDDNQEFWVRLFDATGAKIVSDWRSVFLREGASPARVSLTNPVVEVAEGAGIVSVPITLSGQLSETVEGRFNVWDRTAHVAVDYRGVPEYSGGPWSIFEVPAGQTTGVLQFEVLDDDLAEPVECFEIRQNWFLNAEPGIPAVGLVCIIDDDGGAP